MQTMQQRRARQALTDIQGVVDADKQDRDFLKALRAYVNEMPAMIHMSGLGQAAAFYRSKGNGDDAKARARLYVYNLLSGWLRQDGQPYQGKADLLDGITTDDMQTYRLAQAEAMAYMDWAKKFATAFIEVD
jgi:CRISPR-associated protein Cmr5